MYKTELTSDGDKDYKYFFWLNKMILIFWDHDRSEA